jgi:PTH1 family peptidyl-tRNA hydrolase
MPADSDAAPAGRESVLLRKDIMYIIAGLGNPGREYEGTRHNTGFAVIDCLAEKHGIRVNIGKFSGLLGSGMIGAEKAVLVKPLTYMNLSGMCLQQVLHFYKVPADHLIVAVDDINLPVGQIRVRGGGSAGGHNGLKSIIEQCGTQDFPRVRVGVGDKKPGQDLASHVLSRFPADQAEEMKNAEKSAAEAIEMLISDGLDLTMNRYNRKVREE